jgi:hypothetical protein
VLVHEPLLDDNRELFHQHLRLEIHHTHNYLLHLHDNHLLAFRLRLLA